MPLWKQWLITIGVCALCYAPGLYYNQEVDFWTKFPLMILGVVIVFVMVNYLYKDS